MDKKTVLLATTALAAAQFGAIAPAAAQNWDMTVGGFMSQYFGYAEGARRGDDGFDQKTDAEIEFTPKITLDNGLEIGVNVQLEAQTEDDQIDQQFAYVEGSFGRIELGSNDNAPATMSIGVPSAGIGLDDGDTGDWLGAINSDLIITTPSFTIEDDSSEQVTYYTPRFAGFQLGASYVPQLNQDLDGVSGANAPRENDGVRDNAFGIAANFERDFNEVSFGASAGYMTYGDDDAAVGPTPEDYGFGLSIGYAGFTLAGAYNRLEDSSAGDLENFGVGLLYETGPLALSLGYIRGRDKSSSADSDAFEFGASYALGPGVSAVYSFYYVNQESAFGSDLEGAAAIGGLALSF